MNSRGSRVSKLEFFVALALAALAQSGKGAYRCIKPISSQLIERSLPPDLSVERVAALAQDNALPIPDLDLSAVAPSTSAFSYPSSPPPIRAPIPTRSYTTDDPWNISKFNGAPTGGSGSGSVANGVTSSISGTGMPKDWWKRQETVNVNILGQQGFLLNRYLVYEVSTDV